MQKKLKMLVSAYACSPSRGSEPGMGWNFVLGLSKYHEVHVITEKKKWKTEIENFIEKEPKLKENLKFYYIEKKRNKKLRKIWPPSYYWYYKKWQQKAYKLAVKLDEEENFDLIHQLNMVGFREPGYLWKIDKPFVWGPIGGMENTELKLLFNLNPKNFVYYSLRNIINTFQMLYLRRPRLAARKTNSVLISATPKIKEKIFELWNRKSDIITEVGSENYFDDNPKIRDEFSPLQIVWCGMHTGGKALNILLESLAKLPSKISWKLNIIGEGEMTAKWGEMAKKLGVEKKCNWYGWISKDEVHQQMRNSDLMCITSMKDLTSTVTLEALSFGLPIICIDHCGFAHVVNENCGIKIPVSNPTQLKEDLAKAIEKIYNDEEYRQKLSLGAINRAKEFSWDKKIEKLNEIYSSLLN